MTGSCITAISRKRLPNSRGGGRAAANDSTSPNAVLAACEKLFQTILRPEATVCVGLSGGLDSMVLLDAASRLRQSLNFQLLALHVNHQLSSNANNWQHFCAQQCAERGVPFSVALLSLERAAGLSLEALAREARYIEFAKMDADVIALGHHLDDQSETLLLQLLRGAGVRGLSAMGSTSECPHAAPANLKKIARPLLDLPRSVLQEYAIQHAVQWIEDESNASLKFDRNYLRHSVFPALAARFPGYRSALARSARHAAEAESLLVELATIDLAGAVTHERLSCARLRELSIPRAKNAVRVFLQARGIEPPSSARITEIVRQFTSARQDASVNIVLGKYHLRRFRDELWIVPAFAPAREQIELRWNGESELAVPALGGVLRFTKIQGAGLRATDATQLSIRSRAGNAAFQPDCKRPHRSLKNLFQEANIPPWQRARLPFLYVGDVLVAIPGLGVACEYQTAPDQDGWVIEWRETSGASQSNQ